ncbi:transposase [Aliarcobacter butzleri]|uniref:transposase n=1 Tax=Aliarcobacter butzleri TaxID=28197 RepID=UPI003AF67522
MRISKFKNKEIFEILEKAKNGNKIVKICEEYRISRQTFYNLNKKYKDLDLEQIKQIIDLENEIIKLKKELEKKEQGIAIFRDIIKKI